MEKKTPFDVEQLIKEVKIRPVLWNSKDPNFNHRQAKTSAWEEVAINLYADSENWSNYDKFGKVRDIQKRWKNLRDYYVKEIKYEKRVQQGFVVAKKKRFAYRDIMQFLSSPQKPPSRSSSEKSSSEDNEEGMETETNPKSEPCITLDEGYSSSHVNQFCKVMYSPPRDISQQNLQKNVSESTNKASTDEYPQRSLPDLSPCPTYSALQNTTRNFPEYNFRSDQSLLNVPLKNSQAANPSSCRIVTADDLHFDSASIPLEEDDDKMFLLSLLPYFKKFSEDRKLEARINMTKLVHNMLYKEL